MVYTQSQEVAIVSGAVFALDGRNAGMMGSPETKLQSALHALYTPWIKAFQFLGMTGPAQRCRTRRFSPLRERSLGPHGSAWRRDVGVSGRKKVYIWDLPRLQQNLGQRPGLYYRQQARYRKNFTCIRPGGM